MESVWIFVINFLVFGVGVAGSASCVAYFYTHKGHAEVAMAIAGPVMVIVMTLIALLDWMLCGAENEIDILSFLSYIFFYYAGVWLWSGLVFRNKEMTTELIRQFGPPSTQNTEEGGEG